MKCGFWTRPRSNSHTHTPDIFSQSLHLWFGPDCLAPALHRNGLALSYSVKYEDGDIEKVVKRGHIAPFPEEVRIRLGRGKTLGSVSARGSCSLVDTPLIISAVFLLLSLLLACVQYSPLTKTNLTTKTLLLRSPSETTPAAKRRTYTPAKLVRPGTYLDFVPFPLKGR